MANTIHLKPNQRMFIEPNDHSPDSTFANTRICELLEGLGKFVDQEMSTKQIGRPDRAKERNFYEITSLSPDQLTKIYKLQQRGTVPFTLWTSFGEGPLRRYTPDKPDLAKLLQSGAVTKGVLPKSKAKK